MRRFLVRAFVPSPGTAVGGVGFVALLANPGNADMLWHLALGRSIVLSRSLPDINSLYYTPTIAVGRDPSWLSQVILYACYGLFSAAGLAVLNALVGALIFYLLYRLLERGSDNLLLNVAILALAYGAISPYLDGRPAALTVLLLTFELSVLDDFIRLDRDRLWYIPLTMVLWVNLHPGFLIAPAVLLVFVVFSGRGTGRLKLLLCLLATCAAVAVNPYVWRLYALPAELTRSFFMLRNLTEWTGITGLSVLLWGVLLAVAVFGFALRKPATSVLALFILAALSAIVAYRNLPLFGVAAVLAIANGLPGYAPVLERWRPLGRFRSSYPGAGGWFWAIALPVTIILASHVPGSPVRLRLNLKDYPVAAVRQLRSQAIPGNIFVRETWSGYLMWEMPENKLFWDAKGGFSPQALRDHHELVNPGPNWRAVAERYNIAVFLLERDSPLGTVLKEADGWVPCWRDSVAETFIRDRSAHAKRMPDNR